MLNFKHSGRLGDIIYSLPTIKAIVEKQNTTARLYIPNDAVVNGGVFHPGGGLMVSQALFDYIKPLIARQPYIESVVFCATAELPAELTDLDLFKHSKLNLNASGNQVWFRKTFSIPVNFETPWITVEPSTTQHERYDVIINKSTRFYNKSINYQFLDELDKVGFVGLDFEYEDFVKRNQLKKVKHIPTIDAQDLAEKLKNCRVFIGNQSLAFAIAEGLKVPRAIEVYEPVPVVIPIGGRCIEFVYTRQIIKFLNEEFDLGIKRQYEDLQGGFTFSVLDKEEPKFIRRFKKIFGI